MMDQLGIKALRPGPSGTETAPNHANYDEATANPYPSLPPVLTLKNGKKVTTPAMWWNQRRPEIVEDFDREVLGRVPKNVPKVTWTVTTQATDRVVADIPVVAKQLIGHVDNSGYPSINVGSAVSFPLVMQSTTNSWYGAVDPVIADVVPPQSGPLNASWATSSPSSCLAYDCSRSRYLRALSGRPS